MIGGKTREITDYSKKVGFAEVEVVAVNPTLADLEELGVEYQQEPEYLRESRDGNPTIRIDFWLKLLNDGDRLKNVSFFLEDAERSNRDETKLQYISSSGTCSWADDPNNLPDWFTKRDYRVAKVGEEQFYYFLRTWLSKLDFRDPDTTIEIDFKKLIKGNLRDLIEQIGGAYCNPFLVLSTIKTVEKEDGTIAEYEQIYNRDFLPAYAMKHFRLVDYDDPQILTNLEGKSKLKAHEKFALQIHGEYGCKDYFKLKELADYNSEDNVITSNNPLLEEESDSAMY